MNHAGSRETPSSQRLWIALKFGYYTNGIERRQLEHYVSRLVTFLNRIGMNLAGVPLRGFLITDDIQEAEREIAVLNQRSNQRSTQMLIPIVFLIDDYHPFGEVQRHLTNKYSERLYLFTTNGSELLEMLQKNDFKEAEMWCDEFLAASISQHAPQPAAHLPAVEHRRPDSPSTNEYYSPAASPGPSQGRVDREEPPRQGYNYAGQDLHRNGSDNQNFQREQYPREDYPNARHGPSRDTGEHHGYSDQRMDGYNRNQNEHREDYRDRHQDQYDNRRERDGRYDGRQDYQQPRGEYGQEEYRGDGQGDYNHQRQQQDPDESPHLVSFDCIATALSQFPNYSDQNRSECIVHIAGDKLFNRFAEPYCSLDKNQKLMELIVVCSDAAVSDESLDAVRKTLLQMAQNQYIGKVCDQIRQSGDDSAIHILKTIMRIFLKAFDVVLLQDRHHFNNPWDEFSQLLYIAPASFWAKFADDKKWLEQSAAKLNGEPDPYEVAVQKKPNFYNEREFTPMWKDSETKEPPEDFRIICHHPIKKDIINPTAPYLRRSITDGAYSDAAHYLDVQFRLFREDLVAPLRDGIYNHKWTGGHFYCRTDGDYNNPDVVVFDVVEVRGLQVRANNGENLRYVELMNCPLLQTDYNRHLKFGQHVVLSSDGFEKDLHLAVITERNDAELLTNGLLGLRFLTETGLEMRKPYKLLEPSSYLEMYIHVLKVMQEMDRFTPLPMERYLVDAKSEKRLPKYLRIEDDEEDKEREKKYQELRLKHHKNKVASAETEGKEENHGTLKLKKTVRSRFSIADERAKTMIRFRGHMYRIPELEETLQIEDYDPSQREALISAMTNEMALIQGPPGTGKTFIGVEIVRMMLENRDRLGIIEPILLVCYTNAALDQFLEKILDKVERDIRNKRFCHDGPIAVRLGSKSDSTNLERAKVMRKDVVSEYRERFAQEEDKIVGKASKARRTAAVALGQATYIVSEDAQHELPAYTMMQNVIPDSAKSEMLLWGSTRRDSKNEKLDMDEVLACWLLNKSLEGASSGQLPPEDSDEEPDLGYRGRRLKRESPDSLEDDAAALDQVFKKMNIRAAEYREKKEELWNNRDEFDKLYETTTRWDVVKTEEGVIKKVKLFGDGALKTLQGDRGSRMSRNVPYDASIIAELLENRQSIIDTRPLSEQEAEKIRSIYELPKQRRWELFSLWNYKLRTMIKNQIPGLMRTYKSECERMQEALHAMDAKVLRKSLIIGATTTGAAKFRNVLEQIGCRILVIEEAAEVLEAHTFASLLPTIEHAVLIGDHQQLRPNPSVYELAKTYKMDVSLFERLIKNNAPFVTLEKQHRMHPDITKIIVRPHFYKMLKDADEVAEYPEVSGMAKRLYVWTHEAAEASGVDGVSYSNAQEVKMIGGLLEHIFKQGYSKDDVTVIATYSAQVEFLRKEVTNRFGMNMLNTQPSVKVETVDSYQGKENKIIVVSLVRSKGNTIGFLQTANRICVALTRAQHGMYVVANLDHLAQHAPLWNDILASVYDARCSSNLLPIKCRPHGTIQHITAAHEFIEKSPDGGCNETCGTLLSCAKHTCPRKCHPVDDHSEYACKADCTRTCSNRAYNHLCKKRCFEDCGLCQEIVSLELRCEHFVNVACHMTARAVCDQQCETILLCNHRCAELCGRLCTTRCQQEVDVWFPCRHVRIVPCHMRADELKCTSKCEEMLPCGHECQEICGQVCTFECKEEVLRPLRCGHEMVLPCSADPLQAACNHPVRRTLGCGHTCDVPCHAGDDRAFCAHHCGAQIACGHACDSKCGDCYKEGMHKCPEVCRKLLNCGHQCRKRCGEPCGSCEEECLVCCSHISCGKERRRINETSICIPFHRTCSQLCVLCTKRCDNRCEHRACNRKCYELCDVKLCEKSCSLQLRCKHACLGLCGEECPDICGTCQKMNYKRLLNQHSLNDNEFQNLVKIPGCGHIFPVSVLDSHVLRLKEENRFPHCPVCFSAIHNIKRYAKIIKKFALDAYSSKEIVRNLTVPSRVVEQASKVMLQAWIEATQRKNTRRTFPHAEVGNLVNDVHHCLSKEIFRGKSQFAFWKDLIECLTPLCQLVKEFLEFGLTVMDYPKLIKEPPNFSQFADGIVPRNNIYYAVNDRLEECRKEIETYRATQLSGSFVPNVRFLLSQILFYTTIWEMRALLARKGTDISHEQIKTLKLLAGPVKRCQINEDFGCVYKRFLNYVNDHVLKANELSTINYDQTVKLPEF